MEHELFWLYHRQQNKCYPQMCWLAYFLATLILPIPNLFAHYNISKICFSGQISPQSPAVFLSIWHILGGNTYFAGDGTLQNIDLFNYQEWQMAEQTQPSTHRARQAWCKRTLFCNTGKAKSWLLRLERKPHKTFLMCLTIKIHITIRNYNWFTAAWKLWF